MAETPFPVGDGGLPIMDSPPVVRLPDPPADAAAALQAALQASDSDAALKAVCARWPAFVDAWALLGEHFYRHDQDVEAFACFRTGYHRGLDLLRKNGWRGHGYVPYSHEPNRGTLRAIRGLMLASAALGEPDEAGRCRKLLLDSDPADPFGVRALPEQAFETRMRLRE
jgi:hypothetical protein